MSLMKMKTQKRKMTTMTKEEIEVWFTYHSQHGNQPERYELIRNKAKELAIIILDNSYASADQTAAIRKLRECVMTVNASIACE